jgi:hypothetical protein
MRLGLFSLFNHQAGQDRTKERTAMKGELKVQTSAPKEIVLDRVAKYMKSRGYSALAQPPFIIFTRGSLLGSLTAFNPAKWKAKVSVELNTLADGSTEAAITCTVNTTGQRLLNTEMDYWNAELQELAQVIRTGVFDLTPVHYTERRAASFGKFAFFMTIGGSILAFLLLTFLIAPVIENLTRGLTWEELLRTDTLTRQVEGVLLPIFGGSLTRLLATGALLAALFVGAIQPMRQRTQNNLDELLQALSPTMLKVVHLALDVLVVLYLIVAVDVGSTLVNQAPAAEQQLLIYAIVIGVFVIVIVAAVQQRRKKRQHNV